MYSTVAQNSWSFFFSVNWTLIHKLWAMLRAFELFLTMPHVCQVHVTRNSQSVTLMVQGSHFIWTQVAQWLALVEVLSTVQPPTFETIEFSCQISPYSLYHWLSLTVITCWYDKVSLLLSFGIMDKHSVSLYITEGEFWPHTLPRFLEWANML